jgi:hypothetical protein
MPYNWGMLTSVLEETLTELAEHSGEALRLVFLYGLLSAFVVAVLLGSFLLVVWILSGRRAFVALLVAGLVFFLGELTIALLAAIRLVDSASWLRLSPALNLIAGAIAFGAAIHRLYFQPGATHARAEERVERPVWQDGVVGAITGAFLLLLSGTLFPSTFAIAQTVGLEFSSGSYARGIAVRLCGGQAIGLASAALIGIGLATFARRAPRVYEYIEIISALMLVVAALVLVATS